MARVGTEDGIKAEIHVMDWGEALRRMRAGEFDVIDCIVETAERRNDFDFTPAYTTIEASIYFRNDISGIRDVASLKGFPLGVKAGDQLEPSELERIDEKWVGRTINMDWALPHLRGQAFPDGHRHRIRVGRLRPTWRRAGRPRTRRLDGPRARGHSTHQRGASTLGISVKTIEAHRANVMRKLHLRSVSDLVRYAIRNKIVQP